jgi:hypothetical protein
MAKAVTEEESLLEFIYAAPVGLVEIDSSGAIAMINPYAMKHLLPVAGMRNMGNLFAMLEGCAPVAQSAGRFSQESGRRAMGIVSWSI